MRAARHRKEAEQATNDFAKILRILAQRREESVPWSTLQPSLDFPAGPLSSPTYEADEQCEPGNSRETST